MSQPAGNGRVFAVELGKLMAAFIVTIIHLTPYMDEAAHLADIPQFFAVPYFMISALHFTVRKALVNDDGVLSGSSFERVAWPYLSWTLLYTLMRCMKNGSELFAGGLKDWFDLLFLGKSGVQLYFLPLLLFSQVMAIALVRMWKGLRCSSMAWSALAWLLAGLAASLAAEPMGYPFWSFSFVMALVYGFLAMASNYLATKGREWQHGVVIFSCLMLGFLVLIAGLGIKLPNVLKMFYAPLCGFFAFLILLRVRSGVPPVWLEKIVSCYFGIYLMHHAFEEGLEVMMARIGHPLQPYTLGSRLVVALLVCAVSVIVTLLLRRRRMLALVFLGERTAAPGPP